MKTDRRFEQDVYAVDFEARVMGRLSIDNHEGVVLDHTLFYPTGGGQPHDIGWLGDFKVVDVQEQDDGIVHFLEEGALLKEGDEVRGRIDWERRFDHMQQHTGQHLLSAAFVQVAQANTRGFHLGVEAVTIDLDRPDIPWPMAHDVEAWANQKVWENHSIRHTLVAESETEKIPFRRPPKVEGDLRVVEIDETDWSACCGTHVKVTGEVGLIKILRLENYKGGTRVHFVCGGRALAAFQAKHLALGGVARLLTVQDSEAVVAVERLQSEKRELGKAVRDRESQLLTFKAEELVRTAQPRPGYSLIQARLSFGDMKALQQLSRHLTADPQRVVLLGAVTDRTHLVFARSRDVDIDMRPLFQWAADKMGARGGGSAQMVQGSADTQYAVEDVLKTIAGQLP